MARVTGIVFEVKDNATGTIKKIETEFVSATTKMGNEGSKSNKKIKDSNEDLVSSLTKTYFQIQILEGIFSKFFSVPINGFKSLTEEALKFEKSIALVSTLVDTSKIPVSKLNKEVSDTAIAFGQDKVKTASAYYEILSSGAVDASEANQLLAVASKMAVAGGTEVDIAMGGLTTTMAAYGLKAENANDVSDAFFAAAAAGKTNIKELSHFIGESAAVASQAGIGYDELLAAIAAGSTTLGSTRFAVTGLNQAIQHILAPTEAAKKEAARLGIEFSAAGIQAKGLRQYLLDLVNAPNMTAASMKRLFESIEAVKLVSAITANDGAKFAESLEVVNNRAEMTSVAFEKMAKTADFMKDRMVTALSIVESKLGTLITETALYKGVVSGIGDAADDLQTVLSTRLSDASAESIVDMRLVFIDFVKTFNRGMMELTESLKPLVRFFDLLWTILEKTASNFDNFRLFINQLPLIGPIIGPQINTVKLLFDILNNTDFGSGAVNKMDSFIQFLKDYNIELSRTTTEILNNSARVKAEAVQAEKDTSLHVPGSAIVVDKKGKEKKEKGKSWETLFGEAELQHLKNALAEEEKLLKEQNALIADLENRSKAIRAKREKRIEEEKAFQLKTELERIRTIESINRKHEKFMERIYEEDKRMYDEHANDMAVISKTFGSIFTQAGKDILEGTKTIGDVFEDLLEMILTKVAEFLVSSAIQAFLMFITGGVGGGIMGIVSSIFGGGIMSPAYSKGGPVKTFAGGGFVSGGMPNVDSVPALLTPGEFVLSKDVVTQIKQGRNSLTSNSNSTSSRTNNVTNNFSLHTIIPPTTTDFDRLISSNVNPSLNRISKRGVVRRR